MNIMLTPVKLRNLKLAILLLLLNVADVWTTHVILSNGGVEGNPLMAPLFENYGFIGPLLLKTAVSVTILALAVRVESRRATLWIGSIVAAYIAVVAWNLSNLLILLGAS